MSLEEALSRNSDLLTQHNELLLKVLGAAGGKAAAPAEEKPKGTRGGGKKGAAPADEGSNDETTNVVTFADLRGKLSGWLGEFAKDEDKDNPAGAHPEVTARREALSKALSGLKVKKLPEIEGDDEKITKLDNWYETKAKVVDKGHGAGRFVADPVEDEPAGDDDDMGL